MSNSLRAQFQSGAVRRSMGWHGATGSASLPQMTAVARCAVVRQCLSRMTERELYSAIMVAVSLKCLQDAVTIKRRYGAINWTHLGAERMRGSASTRALRGRSPALPPAAWPPAMMEQRPSSVCLIPREVMSLALTLMPATCLQWRSAGRVLCLHKGPDRPSGARRCRSAG